MASPHPWREANELGVKVDLRFHPGDPSGETEFHPDGSVTVSLSLGLDQTQRRSVLQHELAHARRGPFPSGVRARAREEAKIRAIAARLLVPFPKLVEAYRIWHENHHELADACWVDYPTMATRLQNVTEEEAAVLREIADDERHP